jgi:hypothetical protein
MPVLFGGGLFLVFLLIMQTAVVSRLQLLYGSADLFLLFLATWSLQSKSTKNFEFALLASLLASAVSSLPFYIYFITYFGIVIIVSFLKKRIWQTPLLALTFVIIVATITEHGLTIAWLRLTGTSMRIEQSLALVSVPSLLLNLLLSIPFYAFIHDATSMIYPTEDDV